MINYDYRILDYIHEHLTCHILDVIMPVITSFGNNGYIWIAVALLMLIIKKYRRTGLKLCAALISGAVICNLLLKNLVARDRPCWSNEEIQMLINIPEDYSFPSGHTLASFSSAGVIISSYRKAGIAAYITAVLIAFSRMYLYVHFPTDVLGGALIGSFIAVAVCLVFKKYFPENKEALSV